MAKVRAMSSTGTTSGSGTSRHGRPKELGEASFRDLTGLEPNTMEEAKERRLDYGAPCGGAWMNFRELTMRLVTSYSPCIVSL